MKREKTDTVQLSKIRMKEELRRKLAKDAERQAMTLNGIIVDYLERYYLLEARNKELQQRLDEAATVTESIKGLDQKLDEIKGAIFTRQPLGPLGQAESHPDMIANRKIGDEEGKQ